MYFIALGFPTTSGCLEWGLRSVRTLGFSALLQGFFSCFLFSVCLSVCLSACHLAVPLLVLSVSNISLAGCDWVVPFVWVV